MKLLPSYSLLADKWLIDKTSVYLNHGAFGACPIAVLDKQQQYRQMLETHPIRFMIRELDDLLAISKQKLSDFVGAKTDDIVFVVNATQGVNTVLRSLDFNPGDQIMITNHIYPACRNTVNFIAQKSGAEVVEVHIDLPVKDDDELIEPLISNITSKTRFLLIDHITSPTGLIFPVKRIVQEFEKRGIPVMVDGAHAPGQIDLDVEDIGASYYTANCHKWICAPKGSAFLHVRKDRQHLINPLTISLYAGESTPFTDKFHWTGTSDPTPFLSVGDALDYMPQLIYGGWKAIMEHNHNLAVEARKILCEKTGSPILVPDHMMGALAIIAIPKTDEPLYPLGKQFIDPLQQRLFQEHGIEVPVVNWPGSPPRIMRIAAQLYNTLEQYKYLILALQEKPGI